jgi:hypothetical protein
MGEYDEHRVEPHTVLVGMGMGATPERIADIEERQRQLEKLSRPKPNEAFDSVMSKGRGAVVASAPTRKEQQRQALPRHGPRPSLVHPAQRETYGRDSDSDTVVLKG